MLERQLSLESYLALAFELVGSKATALTSQSRGFESQTNRHHHNSFDRLRALQVKSIKGIESKLAN